MKKSLLHLLAVVAIILASVIPLTGCQPASTPEPMPTEPAAAPADPVAEGPIKIGFFSPTTGFAAADGTSALNAAQLAIKFINDAGGVNGQSLELVYYDDGAKPDQAASIARKLIEQDGVVAGISGSYSGATRAAAPVFQEAGLPMIAAYAIHPEITATGDKIFRVGTLATVQGRIGGELAANVLEAKKAAILTIDNDFGVSLSEGFKARAQALGVEIVLEEKYPLGETEFRPIIGKLKDAAPDVVYATAYYNEAANLVSQISDEGLDVQIIGQEGYDSPKFIELAGDASEGVIITTDLNRDSERPMTKLFLEEYEKEYGEEADMVGASAFDAVQVLAYAIETAGSTDPDAITAAIAGLKDFEDCASGPFWRYTDGREVVRPVSSQIVENGAFHLYHEFTDEELVTAGEVTAPPPPAPVAEGPIKIGFFSPTTGFAAADGTSALNAAQLAIKFINDAGGVNGQPLELVYYDDGAKPDQAASIARKLIEQDGVVAGISGSYSGATRAAAPVFQEMGLPMIAAYAIHPEITATGDKIFRVGTLATVQGRIGGELAANVLGASKVAILTIDNDFGVSLSEGFKARAEALGVEIVLEEKYPLGETEFRPIIGKIKDAAPDVVYATAYYNEAANLVSQINDEGLDVQIIGQEGYDSPKFIELAGDASEGVIITTDLNRDSERPMTRLFLEEYEKEYGEEADMVGASAFDAVQVLAYAIETAGSTDPDAITAAIAGLKDFEDCASGPFWRYTNGREVVRPVSSQIVENGAFHLYHEFTDEELVTAD